MQNIYETKSFLSAKAIYPDEYLKELNVSLFFVCEKTLDKKSVLRITGNTVFRVFDNGEFILHGPARAAKNIFRIDEIPLKKGFHRLVIELSGYNCNSFCAVLSDPFLQCEIECDGNIVAQTGKDFKCYLNTSRYRKVVRTSYQRAFSESYNFDLNIKDFLTGKINPFKEICANEQQNKTYLKRITDMPVLIRKNFSAIETGTFDTDTTLELHQDGYMTLEGTVIFPKSEWEVNPNDAVSQFVYKKKDFNPKTVCEKEFVTYSLERNYTCFTDFCLEAEKDSEIYFIFDEINSDETKEVITVDPFRNTTHNVITYSLKKGKHEHISFEMYTMKYLRLLVTKGQIKDVKLRAIPFENPLPNRISYSFADKRISEIYSAAINSFAQNSTDILMDCPSRERAGWLCDSFFSSKGEQYIAGCNKVENAFLNNYVYYENEYLPEGMLPMCYPSDSPLLEYIPNWALFYLLQLNDNYRRTGSRYLADCSKKNVYKLLDYFKPLENEVGLLEDLKGWIFVEWSKANDFVYGINFPSNMLYQQALRETGELFGDQELIKKADNIKEQILKLSFNGEFFEDNAVRKDGKITLIGNTTECCQYYAFYFGIATKDTHPELYARMKDFFGPTRDSANVYPTVYPANTFIGDYLRLANLLRYGESQAVLDESIDYFYKMAKTTGTLWEHEGVFASLNHCFTCYIVNVLTNAIFGLKEIREGEKKIITDDNFAPMKATVKIHLKDGDLILKNNGKKVTVKIPKGYTLAK